MEHWPEYTDFLDNDMSQSSFILYLSIRCYFSIYSIAYVYLLYIGFASFLL